MHRPVASLLLAALLLSSCTPSVTPGADPSLYGFPLSTLASAVRAAQAAEFGRAAHYRETPVAIDPAIAADFSIRELGNMGAMEEAYGVTFTEADRRALAADKFILKALSETNIRPTVPEGQQANLFREFVSLYAAVRGPRDPRDREPQHAVFLTADVFLHSYNLLYVELLKEMENEVFYPAMKELSQRFYEEAAAKARTARDGEKEKWTTVRNYFAVPHTLFTLAAEPLSEASYRDARGSMRDPEEVMREFRERDEGIDTGEGAMAFVRGLRLDRASEEAVLADVERVFRAQGRSMPAVLEKEYEAYALQEGIRFETDWTQFTPRSHYTSGSLRRSYFRGMNWYIQLPFFVKSPALTEQAFAITQLLAEHPAQLEQYARLESMITFLVGGSDDLMPADYLQALDEAKDAADPEAAIMDFLAKARPPRIKAIPAAYPTIGEVQTADVLLATKGMRFFSGKFIIDSYWTGQLTQGDEAIKPGYTQKLPPMASSLQVMALLGSDYAQSRIPTLDFYTPETREAIDQAMRELQEETAQLTESDWQENLYTGWLWTIRSLFAWQRGHRAQLPRFMQSERWAAKTLQTAAGFWTELRHATLLYAKQSFAELGAGPPPCDPRPVAEPPKGYIEPQLQAYDRLAYLAERTEAGLTERGFETLRNMANLRAFRDALDPARRYAARQLQNARMEERVQTITGPDPWDETQICTEHFIEGESDWEQIRLGVIDALIAALPAPVEGPIVSAKDKRAAVLADVHTGGDSANPHRVLYQGTGVPAVIFTAVKDANGPRLTVGFTYTHYEFTEPYGGPRLTDEDWQEHFYAPTDDPYAAFDYTPQDTWPERNDWYDPLFAR
jgi:hypothetical protein